MCRPLRAPELSLCGADGRRGPRLDGEVIFKGVVRRLKDFAWTMTKKDQGDSVCGEQRGLG